MIRESIRAAIGRWPWGFLGMLALVVAAEHYVGLRSLDFSRPESWDWRSSAHAARRSVRECRLLCFGTSRAQQALVPQVIEERSGLRAWNLSTCWGQAPSYYYELERALKAGARPSAVVVEYHPQCLAGDVRQVIHFWPELLGPREALDLAWTARDAGLLASTVLERDFPSIKDRLPIRDNVRAALRGEAIDLASSTLAYMRNRNRNRGAIVGIRNATFHGGIAGGVAAGLLPGSWVCHPVNETYIRRFLDLAAARGITVYWLKHPYCPELQAGRAARGLDARLAEFIRGFQARYPNLVVLDAERSGYPDAVFLDPAHLDRQGACTLSADVGDAIRAYQAGGRSRWIDLPAYRDLTPGVPVEDLAQSIAALGAKARRR